MKKVSNEEIDKEIARLQNLKVINSSVTKDGFPIEVGKTYYKLESLREGFEEVSLDERSTFEDMGVYYQPDKNKNPIFVRYELLFTTKASAKTWLSNVLTERLKNIEKEKENCNKSIELLNALTV